MHEASEAPASIAEVLPTPAEIEHARQHLITALSEDGIGLSKIQDHLENDISPALERHSKLPNYYGFVTGGTTPAAIYADHLAVGHDQNVGVHLPKETIATEVEDQALRMLCELFNLEPDQWMHRTFTTGATASNVMGLACGREFVLQHAANRAQAREVSVADLGLPLAMCKPGIDEVQILSTVPHSSLGKAAALVGLGRSCIQDVSLSNQPHRFDMKKLKAALQKRNTACLVAISCSEINTGFFATNGEEMRQIRRLCDQYGAWLHVDAAFGLLARVLPRTEVYAVLNAGVAGLELADSITGDAHKLLNVVSPHISTHSHHKINSSTALRLRHISLPPSRHGHIRLPKHQRRLPLHLLNLHHPLTPEHRHRKLPPLSCPARLRHSSSLRSRRLPKNADQPNHPRSCHLHLPAEVRALRSVTRWQCLGKRQHHCPLPRQRREFQCPARGKHQSRSTDLCLRHSLGRQTSSAVRSGELDGAAGA